MVGLELLPGAGRRRGVRSRTRRYRAETNTRRHAAAGGGTGRVKPRKGRVFSYAFPLITHGAYFDPRVGAFAAIGSTGRAGSYARHSDHSTKCRSAVEVN